MGKKRRKRKSVSAWEVREGGARNVKTQKKEREKERERGIEKRERQGKRVGGVWALTLTGPIRPSQDGALLDLAEGLKQPSDVFLALLLAEHPHKQLPVL